jgi:hypothetical protein
MALAGAEIREGHPVAAADFPVCLMNLAGESIRRKPFDHGVRIQERAIDPLRLCAEHSVESNGVGVAGGHNFVLWLSFIVGTNGEAKP